MLSVTTTLVGGGKLILIDRFNPHLILQSIAREQVTWMVGSPTLYRLLLKTPGLDRYDLSSLKLLTLTTEPCPADLARQLHERFGRPLENIYGMTETGVISLTAMGDSWERVAETVGRPYPGVQVRIVDENRQPLPCGAVGEIALLTAQRMAGYYHDPAATAEVFDDQGWFYTGDIGFLGEDGYLRLVDRKKELVIRAGQNIWPAEVESCLMQHPGVRRAAVLGAPHAISGETLWAFIERQPGSALTVAEIKEHCYLHLAPFKIPEEIRFVDQLPLTVTNKVQKFKLRQMTLAGREV
jgi:fatty-acyl-CoA synthase/long-chain acyl-CoA synthetase